jgi:hypothetical protein
LYFLYDNSLLMPVSLQVGADSLIPGSDVALIDMHQLPAALPELLDQPGLVHDRHRHSIELDEEAQQASARLEVVRA